MKSNLIILSSYLGSIVIGIMVFLIIPKDLGIPPIAIGIGSGGVVYLGIKITKLDKIMD